MKTFYNFLVGELYCIKRWYWDTKFAIKSWYQRRTKGYANSECWNLCFSTSEWILPRLKYLRNNLNKYQRPCVRCPLAYQDNGCLFTCSGNQDTSCPIYARWHQKKSNNFNINLPLKDKITITQVDGQFSIHNQRIEKRYKRNFGSYRPKRRKYF